MFKLFGRAGTASFAVEALLEEMSEPYELVNVKQGNGADTPEEFRALNPLGQVPVLVLPDGTAIPESAAIMIYLGDLKPDLGLAPAPSDPMRAVYLRWMIFLSAKLYQSFRHIYHAGKYTTAADGVPAIRAAAEESLETDWKIIEDALQPGPYLLGDRFSAVDIYCGMFPDWSRDRSGMLDRHPNIARLCEHVLTRPAVARVRDAHVT